LHPRNRGPIAIATYTVGRWGIDYVDKILRAPSLPICPSRSRPKLILIVNLKTATTLGITIPPSILARADELIE